jgi:predicted AAA+ superfamily ATPase
LEEFLLFGGYPAVVLEQKREEKQKILGDIFDLFIKKDLGEYLKIEKVKTMSDILKFLAVNNGNKIKYDEIAKIVNVSLPTVKNYLQILKELFILVELKPYFTNKNLELVKIPKIYFLDNGVRNYFIKNFVEPELRQDKGNLFEGFFIGELLKKGVEPELIKYRNDKNQREVDVVLDNIDHLEAYELKYKKNLNSNDFIGIKAFSEEYKAILHLVNLDRQEKKMEIDFILPFM